MPDPPPPFDLLIRGGTVIDGTKAPRHDADIGIRGGRIVAIGDLAHATADRVLDAGGRIVAPGFIDSHTHDDQAVLSQPDLRFKVSQGVTTVVAGNCGISAAPLRADMDLPMPLSLIDAPRAARHATFASYFDALRAQPASVNVAAMVGHSTLRAAVMADLDRPANEAEIAAMRAHVEEAMSAGAIGMSTGTFYPPATKCHHRRDHRGGPPVVGSQGAVRDAHARRGRPRDGSARRDVPHRPCARHSGGGVAPQGAEHAEPRPHERDAGRSFANR